jgi:dual specificity phosphatase 12
MPTRSVSTLTGVPPADAIKADEDAVSDVYEQVSQTGSLAQAAKKLQQRAQAWEDDPEEQAYLEDQRNKARGTKEDLPVQVDTEEAVPPPKLSLAQQRMMAAFAEEEGGDVEMDGNTISVFEKEEEEGEDEFEAPGVTHLQEIQEGLWIGDLVAAMDTAGLEERGIVSLPVLSSCIRLTTRPTSSRYYDPDSPSHPNSTFMPSKLTMQWIPIF